MNEMLANQLFMARKYFEAERELEICLQNQPENKSVKRKLIICLTQTGKVTKALRLFEELVTDDIEFIIQADPVKDDCPCEELIAYYERTSGDSHSTSDYETMLGIIWLYCDPNNSLRHLKNARAESPENHLLNSVIRRIENFVKSHTLTN